jgi:transcriptional regulator with XRE-family HTH domain
MFETRPATAHTTGGTFAALLLRHRRAAGLTQEALAAASGVSARAVSDLERGRARGPQDRTVGALADALGLPVDQRGGLLLAARAGRARRAGEAVARDPEADRFAGLGWCELPAEVADLTGRDTEAEAVRELVDRHARTGRRAAAVLAVSGTPGVGKTAFAVHLGHRFGARYPDGRFFLDLRGMEPAGRRGAAEALGALLLALGVARARIPASTESRAGMYRSVLRHRRLLLILDNAADEAQVRPLLPSSPSCLVVVTSRRILTGLDAVHRMLLGVLRPPDAVSLLASIAGASRVAAEPAGARRVAELCGHLPLALRLAGNRLASRPHWDIANLVYQLSDRRHRLSALSAGDRQVRTAFEVSYRQCRAETQRVFRRLCLAAGPEVTVATVALVAQVDLVAAERSLEELVDASLLDARAARGRYALHDLLRLFATERLAEEEPRTGRLIS